MFMHTATYYMNMYGYMYMAFSFIEAESQYLKYSKQASTYRLKALCM